MFVSCLLTFDALYVFRVSDPVPGAGRLSNGGDGVTDPAGTRGLHQSALSDNDEVCSSAALDAIPASCLSAACD